MTLTYRDKLPDDHPIKRGFVSFVPRRTDTSGAPLLPEPSYPRTPKADPSPDPMQGAVDQIEAALRAKGEQFAKLTPEQYARYMADRANGLVLPLQVYIEVAPFLRTEFAVFLSEPSAVTSYPVVCVKLCKYVDQVIG